MATQEHSPLCLPPNPCTKQSRFFENAATWYSSRLTCFLEKILIEEKDVLSGFMEGYEAPHKSYSQGICKTTPYPKAFGRIV